MGVLEIFSSEDELTLNDIVEKTGLPKTTVFRIVKTFVTLDYLNYDASTRKYSLSPKLFRFGSIAIHSRPLTRWARPIMERIRARLGETVYLSIRSGTEAICIESLPSKQALQVDVPVGHRSPLYAGASAKVLLAGMDDDWIASYLDQVELVALTEKTVLDRDALRREIFEIRSNGYALTYGESIKGVIAVSAPVYDGTGRVVAAMSVLIPAVRAGETSKETLRLLICAGAKELSKRLGYQYPAEYPANHSAI